MKGKLLRIGTIILGNVFVAFAVSTLEGKSINFWRSNWSRNRY